MIDLTRITDPTSLVSTADARSFLRLDDDTEDTLVETLVQAATHEVESRTGLRLGQANWKVVLPMGSLSVDSETILPVAPVTEMVSCSVKVGGTEVGTGSLIQFTPSSTTGGRFLARVLPSAGVEAATASEWTVELVVKAGFPTCPAPIRTWILQRVSSLYEQRGSLVAGINYHEVGHDFMDALLDPFIVHGGF